MKTSDLISFVVYDVATYAPYKNTTMSKVDAEKLAVRLGSRYKVASSAALGYALEHGTEL